MESFVNFYEEKNKKENICVSCRSIPKGIQNPETKDLWKEAMCMINAPDGTTIFSLPCTASSSLAEKVDFYMKNPTHIYEKFNDVPPQRQDIFKAAGLSKSTWGRINSGELADLERGNVFALGIALRLNEEQLIDLLHSAGFCLNCNLDLDRAMLYFIRKGTYKNMKQVKAVLSEICDVKNGLDCFFFNPPKKSVKKKQAAVEES